MDSMIEEYGGLVISIICVGLFFGIFHMMLFGADGSGKGITYWYNNDIVDMDVYTQQVDTMGSLSYSPHFKASQDINDYKIRRTDPDHLAVSANEAQFDFNDAMQLVKVYMDDEEDHPFNDVIGNITVNVTEYAIELSYWMKETVDVNGNRVTEAVPLDEVARLGLDDDPDNPPDGYVHLENPMVVYSDKRIKGSDGSEIPIYETDKYGNVIKDDAGNPIPRKQPKYNERYLGQLGSDTFTGKAGSDELCKYICITNDYLKNHNYMPTRYKLVYRVEIGRKKAEFTTLIIEDDITSSMYRNW